MKKILIIGDTHFIDKYDSYLNFQIKCIKRIIEENNTEYVVFLGDVSDKRKPSPNVLLAIQDLLKDVEQETFILRGNHDSNSKSDDGVTYLSLFKSNKVSIIEHTKTINISGDDFLFIPHYENQERIVKDLANINKQIYSFGHFGYNGVFNSAGDFDFNLPISSFRIPCCLGHIHHHIKNGLVTVLGTPYSTNFQEAGYNGVVGIIEIEDGECTFKTIPVLHGPRYLTYKFSDLESNKHIIIDQDRYTVLRVLVDPTDKSNSPGLIKNILEEYKVAWVDLKFVTNEANIEGYSPYLGDVPKFDDGLLNRYLANIDLPYDKQDMMDVYQQLKNIDET